MPLPVFGTSVRDNNNCGNSFIGTRYFQKYPAPGRYETGRTTLNTTPLSRSRTSDWTRRYRNTRSMEGTQAMLSLGGADRVGSVSAWNAPLRRWRLKPAIPTQARRSARPQAPTRRHPTRSPKQCPDGTPGRRRLRAGRLACRRLAMRTVLTCRDTVSGRSVPRGGRCRRARRSGRTRDHARPRPRRCPTSRQSSTPLISTRSPLMTSSPRRRDGRPPWQSSRYQGTASALASGP